MQYKGCFYEALTRHMYVHWAFIVNNSFSEDEVRIAIQHVHSKHPYLRSIISEGPSFSEISFIDNGKINSVMEYSEEYLDESVLKSKLEEASDVFDNDSSIVDTVRYKVICCQEKSITGIIACFCHSCVDALSSLRVASDILYYLDNPNASMPLSREYVSVQTELIVKEESEGHIRFAN